MQAASLALALVLGTGEPDAVLYDFGAPRCIYCQQMNPIVDRLIEQGHPIVKVNCDQQPDLARQYQVQSLPTFLLVVDGQVVDRCTGKQSEDRLRQMLARIPEPQPEPQRTASAAGAGTAQTPSSAAPVPSNHIVLGESGPFPEATQPRQESPPVSSPPAAAPRQITPPAEPPFALGDIPTRTRSNSGSQAARADFEPPSLEITQAPQQQGQPQARANIDDASTAAPPTANSIASMAASVRIRVIHSGRINLGSGTLIVSQPGRSLIITCGHIFRDLGEGAKIEVDVFNGREAITYVGTLLDFDIEAEVGLITIPTDSVLPTVAIAPANRVQQTQDHVASIGCSGGQTPSREQLRITAIDKYEGPNNIECTGTPVQGRSGGGLFNNREELVGICFSAGVDEPLGLYAGPRAMYSILEKYGLTALYAPEATQPAPPQVAEATPPADPYAGANPQGYTIPPIELGQHSNQPFAASAGVCTPETCGPRANGFATTTQSLDFDAGEAEVVCLITEPDGNQRVVVLHRASPKFVAYLSGELDGTEALSMTDDGPATTTVTSQRVPRPASAAVMTFAASNPAPAGRPYTAQEFQPTSLVQPIAPRAYVRQR